MGYISDMSSEAKLRSLAAVLVQAGSTEEEMHAGIACRAACLGGGWGVGRRWQRRPHTPKDWDLEVHVSVCAHVHLWAGQRSILNVVPWVLSPLFFEKVTLTGLSCPSMLCWLISKPWRSACFSFPSTEITRTWHHIQLLDENPRDPALHIRKAHI